jgi:septal ring factor EnvC (AmiA/AmiB activator)
MLNEKSHFKLMPKGRTRFAAGIVACLVMFGIASFAIAAEKQSELQKIRDAINNRQEQAKEYLDEADKLGREIGDLKQKSIRMANDIQVAEERTLKIEDNIDALLVQETKIAKAVNIERRKQSETLSALTRISREPTASLVLRYDHPIDAARAAMLLNMALPALERRAKDLGEELTALRDVRAEIETQRNLLTQNIDVLEAHRQQLAHSMENKAVKVGLATDSAERMQEEAAALSQNAKSMRALVSSLEKSKKRREKATKLQKASLTPLPAISQPTGTMALPARGRVIQKYGRPDKIGGKTEGLTLQARPRAQVVAPYDGEILFAGPFKGYGQVLIISVGEGYHVLLAGLSRINGIVGQLLLRGEPVGQMGTSDQSAVLYIEIRKQGTPVNPSPWLAMDLGKGRG